LVEFCAIISMVSPAEPKVVTRTENVHNMLKIAQIRLCLDQRLHCLQGALDGAWELVNILGLDNGFKIVFEHLCEVVYGTKSAACFPPKVFWRLTLQF
jgi:hypothetical protein